jgi:hypothetical protein
MKQLGSCIGCEDVHANIFIRICLTIQIMFKLHLKIKGVFAPQSQKASPNEFI